MTQPAARPAEAANVRLFHTAPISGESWLRILGVAATVFAIVELEKWIRFGRGRAEHALPE